MDQERYKECAKYFEERVFGIRSYFKEGYITITAFSIFDMLRFFIHTEPEFLFAPEVRNFATTVGIKLPYTLSELSAWKDSYLNITEITADIKKSTDKNKK